MASYLFIFLITFILSLFAREKENFSYVKVLIIVFIPLFLYGALRTECMDMDVYEASYESMYGNKFYQDVNERYEIGYSFLNYIVPSFKLLIAIQSLVYVSSCAFICKRYLNSKYLWLFIVLFFLSGEKTVYFFTAMRNTIAVAIFLFSIPLIEKRKVFYFGGMVIIASLFHTSALFFMPLAYIVGRNTTMRKWECLIWCGILVFLLIMPVSLLVDQVSVLIVGNDFEKYAAYLETAHENGFMSKVSSVFLSGMILYDIIKNPIDKTHLFLGRISLLFTFFPLVGSLNLRATYYYCLFILLYTVYALSKGYKHNYRIVFAIVLSIYATYAFFVVDASSPYSGLSTYKSLIDKIYEYSMCN